MKTIHKTLIAISLSAIIMPAVISSAYAHGDKVHKRHDNDHHMLKQLDLTQSQKENASAIIKASRVDSEQNKATFKALHLELQQQIKQDKWDEAQVAQLIGEIDALKLARAEKSRSSKQQIWALLSPEQQVKFVEIEQSRIARASTKMADKGQKRQEKLIAKLALTDEQKTTIEPLFEQLNDNRKLLQELKLREKKAFINILKNGDDVLPGMPMATIDTQSIAIDNANLQHRIWHTLNAEQQQTFERFIDRQKHNMKKQRGHRS
ncbi:Spy/CpxP family protein refolding chaperone [Thalassotalea sp. LPB0316]|uniref:Spy/CpxP family protein refolding chaperone n=1 Tax=Thalassotalea sp. LPB0316 TaxID=2769490 RepID=UPI00186807FC|nr:Spy/CpxP family protein refolding chaperone [Thalassotalea sp. LPB0316]QOL26785.1 Spy/CpxP family protein refolding chaperone [Thalassotalea sp. LPB0316]